MCPMQEWERHYFKFIFQYLESFRYLQNLRSKIIHSLMTSPADLIANVECVHPDKESVAVLKVPPLSPETIASTVTTFLG